MITISYYDAPPVLRFDDIEINEAFNIAGCDYVYIKVQDKNSDRCMMYDIETGRVFPPTLSAIELRDVEITIT
jgi:hypothetical protein